MPRLTIRYGDLTLHDDDVAELAWTDTPAQITVTAKIGKRHSSSSNGGGLMDLLAGARKAQTQSHAAERRRDLERSDSSVDDKE